MKMWKTKHFISHTQQMWHVLVFPNQQFELQIGNKAKKK